MKILKNIAYLSLVIILASCSSVGSGLNNDKLKPIYITEKVNFDTDDPAIWIHPTDASKSIIIGTDKDTNGSLFAFDITGKIVNKVPNLKRPNNVDLRYGFVLNGQNIDIAALTERETNKVKLYSLPELKEVGEFSVFDGEQQRSPMGISLYKNPETQEIYAIVGRKTGPSGSYLWQYKLVEKEGKITGELVRKFGNFNGGKEIESIAVDDALGYIYYSDEGFAVHQYYADPNKGNDELLLFGKGDFKEDIEGISIYPTSEKTGYILVSNQQANTFNVYLRENPAKGRIAEIPVSTLESDGSDVSAVNLNAQFPKGIFVAMTNGKVFHIYDWRDLEAKINSTK